MVAESVTVASRGLKALMQARVGCLGCGQLHEAVRTRRARGQLASAGPAFWALGGRALAACRDRAVDDKHCLAGGARALELDPFPGRLGTESLKLLSES